MGGTYILRKGHSDPTDLKDVTSTAAEINVLDGITANVAELNDLDLGTKSTLIDDFLGTWAIGDAGPADLWASTAGSGTANQVATTVANALNGTVTLKSASDDGNHAANGSTFTGVGLAYKANQGGLILEARIAIDDISEAALFVGFTDVVSSTVELPIFLVTTAIDSDADNACGVGYDVDGTTKQFFHGGVKQVAGGVTGQPFDAPAARQIGQVQACLSLAQEAQVLMVGCAQHG